jgi:hypothetical protein
LGFIERKRLVQGGIDVGMLTALTEKLSGGGKFGRGKPWPGNQDEAEGAKGA